MQRTENLHRILVEGDGVEAFGLLQDDRGGWTQASLTCVKAPVSNLQAFREATRLQIAFDRLIQEGNSRGSASFRSSLLSLLMDEEDDILWTCVCRFCSSTTAKDKANAGRR